MEKEGGRVLTRRFPTHISDIFTSIIGACETVVSVRQGLEGNGLWVGRLVCATIVRGIGRYTQYLYMYTHGVCQVRC